MSFAIKSPPITPSLEAAEEERKKAPWGERAPQLVEQMNDGLMLLLARFPFWGRLALKMQWTFSEQVKTAAVRADLAAFFNPHFWEKLNPSQHAFLMAHELCHPFFLWFNRLEDRDPRRWNRAQDYVINLMLVECGLEMLTDENGKLVGLYDERFKGMSDVEVYDILEREDRQQNRNGDGSPKGGGEGGEGQDPSQRDGMMGGDCDEGSTEELKRRSENGTGRKVLSPTEIRNELVAQVAAAKQRGDCPAAMERWAGELSEPKLTWSDILKQYTDNVMRRGSTYERPGRRTAAYNHSLRQNGKKMRTVMPLPSQKRHLSPAILAIDSSGSVGQEELNAMVSEVADIMRHYEVPLRLLVCDAQVHIDKEISEAGDIELKGGGGTATEPVFDQVAKNEGEYGPPKILIYFTDLFASFPDEPPPYDVIWVNIGEGEATVKPPFGMVINRNPKESSSYLPAMRSRLLAAGVQPPAVGAPAPVRAPRI